MTHPAPRRRAAALIALPVAAVALAACGGGTSTTVTAPPARVQVVPDGDTGSSTRTGLDARRVAARYGPGVVTVLTQASGGGDAQAQSGLGSGFVVTGDGLIATNAHVVTSGEGGALKAAGEVYVRFADSNQVRAEVRGFDPFNDVALLQVDPAGLRLRPLAFAPASSAQVGDPVVAIGSPFGEEQSVSIGVVSALQRSIRSLTGFDTVDAIQTDAAINRGNSGGPLLDARGRVVGINSQIETTSGDGSGVGFAVSAATVRRSIAQLRRNGRVAYSYLGVSTVPVYPQLGKKFDLGTDHGAWVQKVPGDGPAEKAGVEGPDGDAVRFQLGQYRSGGDVIVGVDDMDIRTSTDLAEASARFRPGQVVTLRIVRDGRPRDLRLRLGRRPAVAPSQ